MKRKLEYVRTDLQLARNGLERSEAQLSRVRSRTGLRIEELQRAITAVDSARGAIEGFLAREADLELKLDILRERVRERL